MNVHRWRKLEGSDPKVRMARVARRVLLCVLTVVYRLLPSSVRCSSALK